MGHLVHLIKGEYLEDALPIVRFADRFELRRGRLRQRQEGDHWRLPRAAAPRPPLSRHLGSPGDTTAPTDGAVTAGGAITIALGSEPTSLDPYLVDDGAERAVNDNIYETLLTRTPTGELEPGLATALPTQVDDSPGSSSSATASSSTTAPPFNADSVRRDHQPHGQAHRRQEDRQRRLLLARITGAARSTTTP